MKERTVYKIYEESKNTINRLYKCDIVFRVCIYHNQYKMASIFCRDNVPIEAGGDETEWSLYGMLQSFPDEELMSFRWLSL